ncbi:MAG: phosphopyruvate hydratase [Acidiphilium sp.]|jgi:enolase (EC 4.2.1.11)|uniref:phosphopyruvate hydratase n=1 Tax=Acidiphilium acidophilum TaxID=76588 RepID=UPI002A1669A9|nr:phosphopyruvate hydratase [Acidiphilium sp.]MEE3504321.1 phosphopyruvate hydratase [Acidiphilium acidophilum]
MAERITSLDAIEILDSRGNPTIRVFLSLTGGKTVSAAVPSGASTGQHEAHERRDRDASRYNGMGVLNAIASVRDDIAPVLVGRDPTDQGAIDDRMCTLDGTPNKTRLGANAILGVSMAVARAGAFATGLPLYRYFAPSQSYFHLPVPMLNVINGGLHAANALDFQEFMLVPHGAPTFAEAMRLGSETYHALRAILATRNLVTAVGDEGGFAPDISDNSEACSLILRAIERAGFQPMSEVALALDPAASSFGSASSYDLSKSGGGNLGTNGLIDLYDSWLGRFPIVSIEDGVAEDDWAGYTEMTRRLGKRIQIVGDDNYVTNVKFIERGIREKCTNAVLIKPNQIGTVSETIAAIELCRNAGWNAVVSHRSGETDDSFIADLAVGLSCGQIKSGAPCRGERLAKYNRLIEIEHELGKYAVFVSPFGS